MGGGSKGNLDESEKQFSAGERKIADQLTDEGKNVKSLRESTVPGTRSAAALVDGKLTEFKSLDLGTTNRTVKNQISDSVKHGGQARDIIIDARGSGLSQSEALQGLARSTNITRGRVDSVRIIGDGYDLTSTDFH